MNSSHFFDERGRHRLRVFFLLSSVLLDGLFFTSIIGRNLTSLRRLFPHLLIFAIDFISMDSERQKMLKLSDRFFQILQANSLVMRWTVLSFTCLFLLVDLSIDPIETIRISDLTDFQLEDFSFLGEKFQLVLDRVKIASEYPNPSCVCFARLKAMSHSRPSMPFVDRKEPLTSADPLNILHV